jgi:hypothetical protein
VSWRHGRPGAWPAPALRRRLGTRPRVVVLLDGFPQTWHERRHVIPRLVDASRRVVAPDSAAPGTRGVAPPSAGHAKASPQTHVPGC